MDPGITIMPRLSPGCTLLLILALVVLGCAGLVKLVLLAIDGGWRA
jgi:hypothetical protein